MTQLMNELTTIPNSQDHLFRLTSGKWMPITIRNKIVVADGFAIQNLTSLIAINQAIVNFISSLYQDEQQERYSSVVQYPTARAENNRSFFAGPQNDMTEIVFCDIYRTRRANVYMFLQYNYTTRKVRILAYGTDHMNHSAMCFGTTIDLIGGENLTEFVLELFCNKKSYNCPNFKKLLFERQISDTFRNVLQSIKSIDQIYLTF